MNHLTLTIVLYLFRSLHQYHISKLSLTPFLLLSISLFVIYTVNLHVVQPRSCQVIYYFDTLALGIRHQSFDCVTYLSYIPMLVDSWNVKGLNSPLKQHEVVHLMKKHKMDVCGLLETKMSSPKVAFMHWFRLKHLKVFQMQGLPPMPE